jgi:site-specific recombinase XerD/ribosomal protein L40E
MLSERNKKLIISFVDDLIIENISKPRLTKYLVLMRMICLKLNKDLDKANRDDLKKYVSELQQREDYSVWTKKTYKIALRKFYKWHTKKKNPKITDFININIKRTEMNLPSSGELLDQEDVNNILSSAEFPRDKALIAMLWESGARIGEVGNLSIKDVVFDQYGLVISVMGKTGARKIRLVSSTPYISAWLNNHPMKDDKNAPVWVNLWGGKRKHQMGYGVIRLMIRRTAEKAGIKKRANPHTFRHSRATYMANHLTEFQMNQYFGWIQGSDMPATYVHMSGKEVDSAILVMNGVKAVDNKDKMELQPTICPRCDTINSVNSKHCNKCGGMLDLKQAVELQEQITRKTEMRSHSDQLMNLLLKDKQVQEILMEKMRNLGEGIGF